MATKIRGRQIETSDFIMTLGNANVNWTDDTNTASQLAIAQLVNAVAPSDNPAFSYGFTDYHFRPFAGAEAIYRYKLCALGEDNRLVPMTVTNQESGTQVVKNPSMVPFRPYKIWLYNHTETVLPSDQTAPQKMMSSGYKNSVCQYNFNATVPANRLVFLCGTYDKDTDMFTLRNDNFEVRSLYYTLVPIDGATLDLSDYFSEGYWYILAGCTYSSSNDFQLFDNNELYYFDGENLIQAQTALNPTLTSQLTNDSGFITSSDVIAPDKHYEYEWVTPTNALTIVHNLNKNPAVNVVDTGGNEFVCEVEYIDENTCRLSFSHLIRGTAYFN